MLINLLKATELLVEGQSANPKTKAANLDTSTAMWSAVVLFTDRIFFTKSVSHMLTVLLQTMKVLALSGPLK